MYAHQTSRFQRHQSMYIVPFALIDEADKCAKLALLIMFDQTLEKNYAIQYSQDLRSQSIM